jgi:methyltransferase (TIGR00027 family)
LAVDVPWEARVAGQACPLDAPRPASTDYWDFVGKLSVSSLYLTKNQTYRGYCQLIFDPRHVSRLDQLSHQEWTAWAADLFIAQQAVVRVVQPDHVNVESLGNIVPHLHWHIIPRFRTDPMWGTPIWQPPLDSMPDTRLAAADRDALTRALRESLSGPSTPMSGVGLTSRWVAASRALETESSDPLYRDPFARALAGEVGLEMLYSMRSVGFIPAFAGPDPYLTIRTKFLDDSLVEAVRNLGLSQVVVLAAGMDARAFRLTWPRRVTVFEVDRDDVFEHKEQVLEQLGAEATCDRRVVVRQDLAFPWKASLVAAGFDPSQPAAFLAEGLLYYLDAHEADSFFDTIREVAAPGSWLGMDTVNPEVLTSPFMANYVDKLREMGCPWKFCMADPESYLAGQGWTVRYALPGEHDAHYGRWAMPTFPRSIPGIPRTFLVKGTRTPDRPRDYAGQ